MEATSIPTQEGFAVFKHPSLPSDTECQTWYKVVGDLSSNRRPLVVLHGGPGASHVSVTAGFDPYAAKTGTPVIYYDQLGNGNSTHLRQKRGDGSFWTSDLFVAELENLVRHLGIRDNFDLYGHSWGAKLAAKYAASPSSEGSGLHKVILASGSCSQKDLSRAAQVLIKDLPKEAQDTIHKYSKEQNFEAPEYRAALMMVFKKHLCRLDPWPKVIFDTMKSLQEDDTVYSTMLGPDGLNPTGSLRGSSACLLFIFIKF
jgi:proline-specific peptidase